METINYEEWLGRRVFKNSFKPFKFGSKIGIVTNVTTNPNCPKNKKAFVIDGIDGNYVNCDMVSLFPDEHIVQVYKYNPDNLKEVLDKTPYVVQYVPTKRWHIYSITINGFYCNVDVNLLSLILAGGTQSPRELVGKSIYNLRNNIYSELPLHPMVCPSKDVYKGLVKKALKTKLLVMGDFKRRDELTELKLID